MTSSTSSSGKRRNGQAPVADQPRPGIVARRAAPATSDVALDPLAPIDGGLLTPEEQQYVAADATSLHFDEGMPYEIWLGLTERLLTVERRLHWYIADAINFGEWKYGEVYSQALESSGLSYGALRNIVATGRAVEMSRRRDNLTFWDHTEVASLPPDEADALLDEYQVEGWTQQQLREQVREKKQDIAREAALAAPDPGPAAMPLSVWIEVGDARSLPLPDGSVHLIVTSPPYGVEIAYEEGDVEAAEWPTFMRDWLREAYRVTVPGGRLALNVPIDTTSGGFRPTYAQAVGAALMTGWNYRASIVWLGDQLGKSTARGSQDSANAPHIIAGAEMIALFSKGEWKRRTAPGVPSDLAHDEWVAFTNGVWKLPGEQAAWEAHPAAFPYEIPRRLLKLLSFPGDTICDPFVGSGTVAIAAKRLGRAFVGVDTSAAYVASARRRVLAGAALTGIGTRR